MTEKSASMRVVHVVPHIDEEASGPSYSVPRLCQELASDETHVELLCLAADRAHPSVQVSVFPQWKVSRRISLSPAFLRALHERAGEVDVVHNHSLWAMPNLAAGLLVPGRGAKLVTAPRGTLSHWALSRSPTRKRLIWPLQRQALFRADCIHAACEKEHDEIRAMGLTQPIAIVPNGVDLPPSPAPPPESVGRRTLLFLSRVHPTKGVETLLKTWAAVEPDHPDWRLVVAGRGDDAYVAHLRALAARLRLERLIFSGPIYGSKKSAAYTDADLLVLPSHSESFGMVVAEALAHATPVVTTSGTPWEGVEREGCGWWVEKDEDTLAETLRNAMALPAEDLVSMGGRGRAWMERDFSWPVVGRQIMETYRWLRDGGSHPSCVRFD